MMIDGFEPEAGIATPESFNHALLCGRIISCTAWALMLSNNVPEFADARVIGLDDETGRHAKSFDVVLPSGRYRVSIDVIETNEP